MAETVRCQMCGKNNPAEVEFCQYCGARVKLLDYPAEPAEALRNVEVNLPRQDNVEETTLRNVEGPLEEKVQPSEKEMERPGDGMTDWLADMRSSVGLGTGLLGLEDTESGEKLVEQPLWEALQPEESNGEKEEFVEQQPAESLSLEADLSSWLASLDQEEDGQLPQPPGSLAVSSESAQEVPIWSNDVDVGEGEQLPELPGTEPLETQPPDWLFGMDEGKSEIGEAILPPSEPSEPMPEWLADILAEKAGEKGSETGELESPFPPPQEETTDWLAELGEGTVEANEVGEVSVIPTEELPAWLAGLGAETAEVSEAKEVEAIAEEELPDRLTELSGESPEMGEVTEIEAGAEEDVLSDWLVRLDEEAAEPEIEGESDFSIDEIVEETLPDWLADIGEGESLPLDQTAIVEGEQLDLSLEENDLAEWLASLEEGPEETAHSEEGIDEGAELRDELAEVLPQEMTESPTLPLHLEEELPDWLKGDVFIEALPEGESAAEFELEEELPGWQIVGPLAGLPDILEVSPDIPRATKPPPVYSNKIRLTRAQRERANLLHLMLANEESVREIRRAKSLTSQRALRWGIALLLLVVSFWQIAAGNREMALPLPVAEVQQVSQLVGLLSSADSVLVAFDYQPGSSGEMDTAAAAIVDHMMIQGASMALVSTVPMGPAVAEHFIQKVQWKHRYLSGQNYVNLGYIPGGVTGLLSFAESPVRTFPYTLDGQPAWGSGPLQGIHSLQDFSLVLVIVDDPQVAQLWVEQVGPRLGETPLAMVISARAEAMVRPYYQTGSKQLQGLIVGLLGGSAYERMTGLEGLGRQYWDVFGSDLILMEIIMVVGGMICLGLWLADRQGVADVGAPQLGGSAYQRGNSPANRGGVPKDESVRNVQWRKRPPGNVAVRQSEVRSKKSIRRSQQGRQEGEKRG